jgi:hypothetical protein
MAQEPDSLAFRFAAVLALAVIILVVMTLAAPPYSCERYGCANPVKRPDLPGSIFEFVLGRSARPRMLPRWKAFPRGSPSPIGKGNKA